MYTPWLGDVLGARPIRFAQWLNLLGLSLSVLVVMELHKWFRSRFTLKPTGYLTAAG
jgi:Ca2+-transporting ATPase